jgi:hypothetical protein
LCGPNAKRILTVRLLPACFLCRVDALEDCVPDHTRQADKIKDLAAKYENMVFMQATDDQMYKLIYF